MIRLRPIRTLLTERPAEEERPCYVSAASGLVALDGRLYVVADDEQSLAVFPDLESPGTWIPLVPGELPLDPVLRKAVKADFELLALLPPFAGAPGGALLAMGSGSTLRRRWAACLPLDEAKQPASPAFRVDLQPLFDALRTRLPALNVEGAVCLGDSLVLLHRGTPGHSPSAMIHLDLATFCAQTVARRIDPSVIREHREVRLEGGTLAFTDGAPLGPDAIVFTAAEEARDNPYDDCPVTGSAIGALRLDGTVLWLERTEPLVKLEGISVSGEKLLLVSDADDPQVAATLYEAALPERR